VEIVEQTLKITSCPRPVVIAALGDAAKDRPFTGPPPLSPPAFKWRWNTAPRSLKAQMKRADRLGAGRVLIVGDAELAAGTVCCAT
jgi:histidyl-tRNA synthetase